MIIRPQPKQEEFLSNPADIIVPTSKLLAS